MSEGILLEMILTQRVNLQEQPANTHSSGTTVRTPLPQAQGLETHLVFKPQPNHLRHQTDVYIQDDAHLGQHYQNEKALRRDIYGVRRQQNI